MSPPIRDGSGSSIGSIRLGDGSEIAEVRTGAGDVLFNAAPPIPNSVIALYDARSLSLSNGATVAPWGADKGPDLGATGSPSYLASSNVSSLPAVSYDGSNDFHTPNSSVTASQPVVIYAVVEADGLSNNQGNAIVDGEGGNGNLVVQHGGSSGSTGRWQMFAGSQLNGSSDDTKTLITAVFDGNNSALREDRSQTASGNAGTGGFDLEAIGVDIDNSFRKWAGEIVYVEIHDGRPAVGVQPREDEIVTDLGLSI